MRSSEGIGILTRFGARRRRMSMRRTVTTIVFSLAALVIRASCGGKVRHPNYYSLNLPAPPDPAPAENLHATGAIREFRWPAYLRQGTIAYKPAPSPIGLCASHRRPS